MEIHCLNDSSIVPCVKLIHACKFIKIQIQKNKTSWYVLQSHRKWTLFARNTGVSHSSGMNYVYFFNTFTHYPFSLLHKYLWDMGIGLSTVIWFIINNLKHASVISFKCISCIVNSDWRISHFHYLRNHSYSDGNDTNIFEIHRSSTSLRYFKC